MRGENQVGNTAEDEWQHAMDDSDFFDHHTRWYKAVAAKQIRSRSSQLQWFLFLTGDIDHE